MMSVSLPRKWHGPVERGPAAGASDDRATSTGTGERALGLLHPFLLFGFRLIDPRAVRALLVRMGGDGVRSWRATTSRGRAMFGMLSAELQRERLSPEQAALAQELSSLAYRGAGWNLASVAIRCPASRR
jgi:hypothetical protein